MEKALKLNKTSLITMGLMLPIILNKTTLLRLNINNLNLNNYPLHICLTTLCGTLSIIIAMLIITMSAKVYRSETMYWIACSLLFMGILDIFISILTPAESMIRLNSISMFGGSLLFIVSIINKSIRINKKILLTVVIATFVISINLLNSMELLNIKATINTIYTLSGLIFLATSYQISKKEENNNYINYLLHLFIVKGLISIGLSYTIMWSISWWYLSLLNLLAFSYTLKLFLVFFNEATSKLINLNSSLENVLGTQLQQRQLLAQSNLKLKKEMKRRKEEQHQNKILQEELIQASQSSTLGRLAAGMAHEINNPAAAIQNDLFLALELLKKIPDSKEQNKLSTILTRDKECISRITQMITAFKSSYKPGAWHLTDINKEIDFQITLLKKNHKNINIIKEYSDLPQIKTYGSEIGQVILNLLINASDAIVNEGTIHITTKELENRIAIIIKDSGSGIPRNIRAKIFDYFYTTKGVNGNGLGLAISKKISQKHKGDLFIGHTSKKTGTSFCFEISKEAGNEQL